MIERELAGGIGERITKALRKNGMNTRELADMAGISEVSLCRIISGKQKLKVLAAASIAAALHTTLDYLVLGKSD